MTNPYRTELKTRVIAVQFSTWWKFWEWRFRRHPVEIRRLLGKQIPVLLWPEELP